MLCCITITHVPVRHMVVTARGKNICLSAFAIKSQLCSWGSVVCIGSYWAEHMITFSDCYDISAMNKPSLWRANAVFKLIAGAPAVLTEGYRSIPKATEGCRRLPKATERYQRPMSATSYVVGRGGSRVVGFVGFGRIPLPSETQKLCKRNLMTFLGG